MNRSCRILALLVSLSPLGRAEDDDPAARWLSVYGWIQTAERLAAADQWPLALGSYLEADRQITRLAADHPAFEPEMVAYRRDALAATIQASEARLTTDEHEVMMKYLDFIESLELGEAQRYRDEYEAAYATLGMAKSLLDEIIAEKPAEFRSAVASQYDRLDSGITWLDSQINFKAASRPVRITVDDGIDRGTTRFVKESDLPRDGAGAPLTGDLFPEGLLAPAGTGMPAPGTQAAEKPPGGESEPKPAPTGTESESARRFRMNTGPKPAVPPGAGEEKTPATTAPPPPAP